MAASQGAVGSDSFSLTYPNKLVLVERNTQDHDLAIRCQLGQQDVIAEVM